MTDTSTIQKLTPVDQRPTIPDEEFVDRLTRVQQLAETHQLDAIVVYGDDRATMGAGHVRWLIDYFPHFEPIAVVVAPGKEPIAITGPESGSYIESTSRFRGDIVVTEEFVHPDEEYRFTTVVTLESVLGGLLNKVFGSRYRLGLVGSDMISPALNAGLRTVADIVTLDKEYSLLRARKTAAELAVIRYAYQIAQEGILAAVDAISTGDVTEREVGAEIDHAIRRAGAEGSGIDTIVAAGVDHTYPILHRTSNRRITPGDNVILTVAPRYEGYHGAIGRAVFVGDVDTRIRDARDVAIEAQRVTAEHLRAGATATQLDRIARDAVSGSGYGDYFLYTGLHSIGVMEFEPPILSGFDDTVVDTDMVFSIDIPMFHTPWGGLRIESGFQVGPDRAIPLQDVPTVLDVN